MLIGFAGYKGVGKDTAAQFLVNELDFTRLAFADKIKEAVANLFGIPVERIDALQENSVVSGLPVCEVILQQYNITEYAFSMREFLQRFGTEMGRNTFGEDFWVDLLLPMKSPDTAAADDAWRDRVITDVRLENEAFRINRLGGYTVEIVRPHYESDGHASEEPLSREWIDAQINNNGTLEDLKVSVYDLYKSLQRQ